MRVVIGHANHASRVADNICWQFQQPARSQAKTKGDERQRHEAFLHARDFSDHSFARSTTKIRQQTIFGGRKALACNLMKKRETKRMTFLKLLFSAGALFIFASCADNSTAKRKPVPAPGSEDANYIPWNVPQAGEGAGAFGGMFDQRR